MPRAPTRSTGGGLRRSNRLAAKWGGASASTLESAPPPSPSPLLPGSGHAGPQIPSPLLQTQSPGGEDTRFAPSLEGDSAVGAESPASLIQSGEVARLKRVNALLNILVTEKGNSQAAWSRFRAKESELILERYKLSEAQKMLETKEGNMKKNDNQEIIVKDLTTKVERARMVVDQLKEKHRVLNDKLLDLKGTVRVFLRLCLLKESKSGKEKAAEDEVFKIADEDPCIIKMDIKGKTSIRKEMKFDHIYGPKARQDEIFKEICPLVQSAIDGNKVCIFTYGQTGSGKTYTSVGVPDVNDENAGILPRTVKFILDSGNKMKVSAIEDHNDKLKDLLSSTSCAPQPQVKRDKDNLPFITDLTRKIVTSSESFSDLLKQIVSRRSTGATKMNNTSSRSHCIFMFVICDEYDKDIGEIAIIDLAGSKSLKETEATGLRKKEAEHISQSLSLLRTILTAIASKKKTHLRFRELKFTQILERFLSGRTKVVMIATVSLEDKSVGHTISTLQFAKIVTNCNLLEIMSPVQEREAAQCPPDPNERDH